MQTFNIFKRITMFELLRGCACQLLIKRIHDNDDDDDDACQRNMT